MKHVFKIVIALWLIATFAWIGVLVGNITTSGWEIIGPWDIWPMVLATVVIIAIVIKFKNSPAPAKVFAAGTKRQGSDSTQVDANTALPQEDLQSSTILEFNGNTIKVRKGR